MKNDKKFIDNTNINGKYFWDSLYQTEHNKKESLMYFEELEEQIRATRQNIFNRLIADDCTSILEAGCGSAIDLSNIQNKNSPKRYGLDYSFNAVRLNKKIYEKIGKFNFICGDLLALPFKSNSFDLVFNAGVIEHFEDPLIPLREMIRVTKKGGYIVVIVPNTFSLIVLMKHMLNILNKISGGKIRPWPVWERSFNYFSLKKLSKKLYLNDIHVEGVHLIHYYYAISGPEKLIGRSFLPEYENLK